MHKNAQFPDCERHVRTSHKRDNAPAIILHQRDDVDPRQSNRQASKKRIYCHAFPLGSLSGFRNCHAGFIFAL